MKLVNANSESVSVFSEVSIDTWLNIFGTMSGALIGTLAAGLISIFIVNKTLKHNEVASAENFRRIIILESEEIEKLIAHHCFWINDNDKQMSDLRLIQKDIEYKTDNINEKIKLKDAPSQVINSTKSFLISLRELRNNLNVYMMVESIYGVNESQYKSNAKQSLDSMKKDYEKIRNYLEIK